MKKVLLFLLIILLIASCDFFGHPADLCIVNRSSSKIYFYVSNKFPDTSLPLTSNYVKPIPPNDGYCFENFKRKPYPDLGKMDKIIIFFFDADTIEYYKWDVIREDYKILERRMLTKQDIINNNWDIVYP